MDLSAQLELIEAAARGWIRTERDAHRPRASPLRPAARSLYAPFFPATTLDRAAFTQVPSIANPPFLAQALASGLPPIAFEEMAGITFDDTVLLSETRTAENPMALLFHELVHVAQYEVLGVDEFARQYVQGYAANGFDYNRIPLEVAAYTLEQRFLTDPRAGFSVADALGY